MVQGCVPLASFDSGKKYLDLVSSPQWSTDDQPVLLHLVHEASEKAEVVASDTTI